MCGFYFWIIRILDTTVLFLFTVLKSFIELKTIWTIDRLEDIDCKAVIDNPKEQFWSLVSVVSSVYDAVESSLPFQSMEPPLHSIMPSLRMKNLTSSRVADCKEDDEVHSMQFKIILLGDGAVGKVIM